MWKVYTVIGETAYQSVWYLLEESAESWAVREAELYPNAIVMLVEEEHASGTRGLPEGRC
jgi:hypothetical protein